MMQGPVLDPEGALPRARGREPDPQSTCGRPRGLRKSARSLVRTCRHKLRRAARRTRRASSAVRRSSASTGMLLESRPRKSSAAWSRATAGRRSAHLVAVAHLAAAHLVAMAALSTSDRRYLDGVAASRSTATAAAAAGHGIRMRLQSLAASSRRWISCLAQSSADPCSAGRLLLATRQARSGRHSRLVRQQQRRRLTSASRKSRSE